MQRLRNTDSVSGKLLEQNMKQNYQGISDQNEEYVYYRKGAVGSSKKELSSDLLHKLEEWSTKNLGEAGVTSEELYGI